MKFPLSRRTVLRGAGVSVALPWLQAMAPVRNAYAAGPKRLIVMFTPNGTIREAWAPTGTENAFTLSRILAPLERHKKDLVVIDGVDNVAAASAKGPGDGHQTGMGCMLTGIELLPGTTKGGCSACPPAGLAGGPSVEQEVVRKTKPGTRFPSLELGVQAGAAGTAWGYMSYRGPNVPLPPDNSPKSVYDRIFSDLLIAGQDNTVATQLRRDRKTVLDAVLKNYKILSPKLGTEDRHKVEAHLSTVDELQQRLSAPGNDVPVSAEACVRPTVPAFDYKANDNFPKVGLAQMDLLTMAFACDLTRVASMQWENSVGGTRFSWLGASRGHHDLSHDPDSTADSKEMLTKINIWFSEQLAVLIDKLKAVKEGDGTLFDSTMILWVNELSRGNAHSHPDMPFLLAGSAGGAIRTGRFLKYTGTVSHNNLLVSVLNAYGVDTRTFGNPAYCTGPLAGL